MKSQVILVGASGHAKVVIEILRESRFEVAFCIGNDPTVLECMAVPVLHGDETLNELFARGYRRAFIGIGENATRKRLAEMATRIGFSLVSAISERSVISPTARLGEGIAIMPGAIVNADTVVGSLSIINTGATVDHDCVIQECVHIGPGCALAGNVTVGEGAFLGVGCSVIPGKRIGRGTVVGAGSVIVSDLPGGIKAVGAPARQMRKTD